MACEKHDYGIDAGDHRVGYDDCDDYNEYDDYSSCHDSNDDMFLF